MAVVNPSMFPPNGAWPILEQTSLHSAPHTDARLFRNIACLRSGSTQTLLHPDPNRTGGRIAFCPIRVSLLRLPPPVRLEEIPKVSVCQTAAPQKPTLVRLNRICSFQAFLFQCLLFISIFYEFQNIWISISDSLSFGNRFMFKHAMKTETERTNEGIKKC